MDSHDFSKSGELILTIQGEMTIKGKTQPVNMEATALVKGAKIKLITAFELTLSDYGIEFSSGKPSKNIANAIQVSASFLF
jgi:polyisoprenoid-binding protein YceI